MPGRADEGAGAAAYSIMWGHVLVTCPHIIEYGDKRGRNPATFVVVNPLTGDT